MSSIKESHIKYQALSAQEALDMEREVAEMIVNAYNTGFQDGFEGAELDCDICQFLTDYDPLTDSEH